MAIKFAGSPLETCEICLDENIKHFTKQINGMPVMSHQNDGARLIRVLESYETPLLDNSQQTRIADVKNWIALMSLTAINTT